jgi:uncharacterized protein with GYD domain
MPKFLYITRYSSDGAAGVVKEGGSSRRDTIAKFAESAGGKLEAFYFAFGEADAYVVIDYPDHVTAAAVALAINKSGGATVSVVPLLTPEEVDRATKMNLG